MTEEEEKTDFYSKLARFIPSIEKPTYKQTFNKRLVWTGVALILYLVLSYISVYGVTQSPQVSQFLTIQLLLGARFGSLMTLGIGPLVTAGILLQLLVGSKIINWDMTKPESRRKFQTLNKFLGIVLSFVEAVAYVVAGAIPIAGGLPIFILVVLQLAAGGIIVLLLDDLVGKWGFGSGISLFIAAGVGSQILIRALSPFPLGCLPGSLANCVPSAANPPSGLLWDFFINLFSGRFYEAIIRVMPIIMTIVVFFIVVYVQDIKINIPLAFSQVRGFGRNWALKFLYTSNIPVILTGALIANLQIVGRIGIEQTPDGLLCGLFGCFDQNYNPINGLIYYLYIPSHLFIPSIILYFDPLRILVYTLFLAISAMIFSIFWVNTSGMDSKSVAKQIESIGLQIPGYRSELKTMEGVLNKYIPPLTVMGGLFVGLLAAFADLTGALGTGTGILLTVMIAYNYYEELRRQKLDDAHPFIRKLLGE